MRNIKGNWRSVVILLLLVVLFILNINLYKNFKKYVSVKALNPNKYSFKNITSIQYQEKKESYGIGDGRRVTNTLISYVYPDKIRFEKEANSKVVEIYNSNRYIYYDNINNKIKLKECFEPERPYITEIEKRMAEIFGNGEYLFFGYEEIGDKRAEVIGIKSKMDGNNYMHKLWLANISDTTLPLREEYFINNSVVSKTTYNYIKINEPISPELFKVGSLPKVESVEDGVIPKYVESVAEAESYLKYKVFVPKSQPDGYDITEMGVTPPVENPSFHCLYFKDGAGIYMRQRRGTVPIKQNGSLGGFPCEYIKEDERVSLVWNQEGLYIILSGDFEAEKDLREIAEEIAGGKLLIGKR